MYIYNRTLHTTLNYDTLHNKRYKNYRTINNIYKFSQYVIIQNENTTKLQQQGLIACWIGLDNKSKGHKTWHDNKITIEQNIQFIEGKPPQIERENVDNTDKKLIIQNKDTDNNANNKNNKNTDNTKRNEHSFGDDNNHDQNRQVPELTDITEIKGKSLKDLC